MPVHPRPPANVSRRTEASTRRTQLQQEQGQVRSRARSTAAMEAEEQGWSNQQGKDEVVNGFVDHRGRPAIRAKTGGWTAARFIVVEEVAERFAFCGIYSNLFVYLTGQLGQPTAAAAANVNAWYGISGLLPFLGGFLADAGVGRYRMIIASSLLYILCLVLLALFSALSPLRPPECRALSLTGAVPACAPASPPQVAAFFAILYTAALAVGGFKPCTQAFGAEQFDGDDPDEALSKSSFFNWWYMSMYTGILAGTAVLSYVQDSVSWVMGFSIPAVGMGIAVGVFLVASGRYRYHVVDKGDSPAVGIARGIYEWWSRSCPLRRGKNKSANDGTVDKAHVSPEEATTTPLLIRTEASDKGLFVTLGVDGRDGCTEGAALLNGGGSGSSEFEMATNTTRTILPLIPIWATSLVYAVIFSQPSTFFTKQGGTLDRRIFGGAVTIPPAALQSFTSISIAVSIPIYSRIVVPIARRCTGCPTGLTTLRRTGAGIFLASACMVTAAMVERKRLRAAAVAGGTGPVQMSIWWLVPQYVVFGASESLTNVGLMEFFYDQMPHGMRSMGLGLYLSIFGIGSLLSSLIVSLVDRITVALSGESWFADDLSKAHLDYFYWLLAGLCAIELLVFVYLARSFVYRKSVGIF